MDLNSSGTLKSGAGSSISKLQHALQVVADVLSACYWSGFLGDICEGVDGYQIDWRPLQPHKSRLAAHRPGNCSLARHALSVDQASMIFLQESQMLPHVRYARAWQRLIEPVESTEAVRRQLVVGDEPSSDEPDRDKRAGDELSGHLPNAPVSIASSTGPYRLTWIVVQEHRNCGCFEFVRDSMVEPFSARDQRVLSVLARELLEPHVRLIRSSASDLQRFPELSRRQRDVLHRLLAGYSVKEAASELGLSPHTVNDYVKALYRHFDVCSRGELLAVVHGHLRNSVH